MIEQMPEAESFCRDSHNRIYYLEHGKLLAIVEHHNPSKYPNQRIYIIEIENYAYLVPFIESDEEIFLKTIIPSRKATKIYLEVNNENENEIRQIRKRNN